MDTLSLKADGNILDIKGVSFNLTLRSPLADQSGSFVYSFSIPYTVPNAKAFCFPYRLTRFDTVQTKKEGVIYINDLSVATGTWLAKSTNGETIKIEMYIAAGDFNETVHEKKLPDLFDIELNYDDIIEHIEDQVELTFPEVNHNWPCVHNPSFYGVDDEKANPSYQGILNDWEGTSVHVETFNNNAISPQLYLGYIIKRMLEYAGYSVFGDVFNEAMFKQVLVYNNVALDRLVPTKFSGEMYNKFPIYDSYVLKWDTNLVDPGSHYTQSTGKYNVDKEGNYKIDIRIKHRPDPEDPGVPEEARLEIYYGTELIAYDQRPHAFGSHSYFILNFDHTEEILQADIGDDIWCKFMYWDISSNEVGCEIMEADIEIQNIDAVENNTFYNKINYKNHVPDMDVKEFFTEFCNTAKILPFFDHTFKKVKLVFLDELLASNKQRPCTDGVHRKSLKVTPQTYEGLKFAWNYNGPDENLNDNFIDIAQADIQGEVETYADLLLKVTTEGHVWFVESVNCYYIWGLIKPGSFLVSDWAASTAYIIDQLVTYDNVIYKCTTAHTSSASFVATNWSDMEWIPYSDNQYEHIEGDGKVDISCAMVPAFMRIARCLRSGTNKYRNLPSVDGLGSSIAYGLKNEFPLRIMFWHGIESTDTDKFPIASTTEKSTEGTVILSINWDWTNIASRYFTNVIRWYKRRQKVEFTKEVTPAEIANNDFEEKGNLEGALVLFEEIYTKIKNNDFGPGKFKGWSN